MTQTNPLGYEPLPQLLKKFAVPSIIAMLVSSLYNIVDQIFVGQGVGITGMAAINIAFPLSILVNAVSLLLVVRLMSVCVWDERSRKMPIRFLGRQ